MRTRLSSIIGIVCLALLAASCTKQMIAQPSSPEETLPLPFKVTATYENPLSKVVFSNPAGNDFSLKWSIGDQIRIWNEAGSTTTNNFVVLKVTSVDASGKATFSLDETSAYHNLSVLSSTEQTYWAFMGMYDEKDFTAHNTKCYYTGSGMRTYLPTNRYMSHMDNIDSYNHEAVAKATLTNGELNFEFKSVMSYLKITMPEDNTVSKFWMAGTTGSSTKCVGGYRVVTFNTDGSLNQSASISSGQTTAAWAYQTKRGDANTTAPFPSGHTVYLPIHPGFTLTQLQYGAGTKDYTTSLSLKIESNMVYDLGLLAIQRRDENSTSITFPAFEDLNQGAAEINDHAYEMERSRMSREYRRYTEIPANGNLSAISAGRYPTYVRAAKARCGDWIVLFNPPAGSSTTFSLPGNTNILARSKDLKKITSSEQLNSVVSYTSSITGTSNKRVYSGAFGLSLQNGDFIIVSSYRPVTAYKSYPTENGLWIRRSTDGGATFPTDEAHSKSIFSGMITWEPLLLQLPDGTIQCYYTADEYKNDADGTPVKQGSGFGLIESKDNGVTWSESKLVARQWSNNSDGSGLGGRFTEQMPAVILLNSTDGTKTFGAAAEDHILGYVEGSETFAISFFKSNTDSTWDSIPFDGKSTGPATIWRHQWAGNGPYLIQFPSGEIIVSYQGNYRMSTAPDVSSWETSGHSLFSLKSGLTWGSMAMKSSHSLVAVGNYYRPQSDGTRIGGLLFEHWGLNHNIKATQRTVSVDGSAADWANTDDALLLGGQSQAEAFLRCSHDSQYAYFLVEVLDNDLVREGLNTDDRVNLYLAAPSGNLDNSALRISVSFDGLLGVSKFDTSAGWTASDASGVKVCAKYDGYINKTGTKDNGYLVEVAVPLSMVPASDGKILFNASLFDKVAGSGPRYDFLSGEEEAAPGRLSTSKWFYIKGL